MEDEARLLLNSGQVEKQKMKLSELSDFNLLIDKLINSYFVNSAEPIRRQEQQGWTIGAGVDYCGVGASPG